MSDEELFGDFEDLETGKVHRGKDKNDSDSDGEGHASDDNKLVEDDGGNKTEQDGERLEKKKKRKAAFDAVYPSKRY